MGVDDYSRVDQRSIWVDVKSWLLIVGGAILLALAIICIVIGILIIENGTVRHLKVDKDNRIVKIRATNSNEEIDFPQPVSFDSTANFVLFFAEYLKSPNASIGTAILLNQTSGISYNLDQVIETILQDQNALDNVLGMPELAAFLQTYFNETPTLTKRRSITRGPDVVTFLYDTQNNITALQDSWPMVNQSYYANSNYAFYQSAATVVPASPSSVLVALSSSGTFAQQVGVSLSSNAFSVLKAGQYVVSFNVAVTQPAAPITETVSLLIGSSAVATATLNWLGTSTGVSSASQLAMVTLATTDVVKLSISASTTGASIYTPGTQVSIWNIS